MLDGLTELLRRAGHRGLRDDGGLAPDDLQPAAAGGDASRARSGSPPGSRWRSSTPRNTCCRPASAARWRSGARTVVDGYENNPAANEAAFTDGWFRTGDEGMLDDEGYLFLTGRLKEQINRGGEKISPLEVDEVLLRHPAVAEAVTFAIPHDKLGEEVGAAVVLVEGHDATEASCGTYLRRSSPRSRCRSRSSS